MPVCGASSSSFPPMSPAGRSRAWPVAVRLSRHGRWQGPTLVGLVVGTVVLALLLVALALGAGPVPVGSRPGERLTALVVLCLSPPDNSLALEDDDGDAAALLTAEPLVLPSAPSPQGLPWWHVRLPGILRFLTRPQLLTRLSSLRHGRGVSLLHALMPHVCRRGISPFTTDGGLRSSS
jgi:hypothetical protein